MDFQELEVLFWKRKNYRNSSFDSNSPPQGHQLFIYICFNILIKKSRKKLAFREPLKISSKKCFLRFLDLINFEFFITRVTDLRVVHNIEK